MIPRANATSINSLTTFRHTFLNLFFTIISSVFCSIRDIRPSSILDTTPPFWIRRFEALSRSLRACWAVLVAARSLRISWRRCACAIDHFTNFSRFSRAFLLKVSILRSFSLSFWKRSTVFGVLLCESPLEISSGGGVAI